MSSGITEEALLSVLGEMCKNDTSSVQNAGDYLLNLMNDPSNLMLFLSMINKPYADYARQLCALFSRRMVLQFYSQFDQATRDSLKYYSIEFLKNEKQNLVKRAICGLVSAIAQFEVPKRTWNEIKDIISMSIQSSEWQDRESGILLLFSISEHASLIFDTDSINQLLLAGLQDPSMDVVCMTIKAAVSIYTTSILTKTVSSYILSIQCCIQLLSILLAENNEEYSQILLSVFTELAVSQQLSNELILSFMELSIPFIQSPTCSYDLKQAATSLLSSSIRYYSPLLLRNNLVTPLITICLEHLSDDITENEDEDETTASLCELILDQLASILPNELVFSEVTSKCDPLITSSLWQHRRSALTALLVIIEYTSDLYRPLLSNLLLQLRSLLFDPVRVVRRKAAFFFSEIADYCTSIFLESAPFIVEDIQKYDITSAMYILECCSEIFENMSTADLQSFIDQLLQFLISAQQLMTQSLVLSCLCSIVDCIPGNITNLNGCIEVVYRLIMQPFTAETSDIHSKCLELLSFIIRRFDIMKVADILPSILEYLYQLVSCVQDFDLYTSVFPFISVVASKAVAANHRDILQYLNHFNPILENCVFNLSLYVDADLPSAVKEYGNLGGSFSDMEKKSYRIVHIDSNRVQCKSVALDTYLSICEGKQTLQGGLTEEFIDNVASAIIKCCETKNETLHCHGNHAAISLIRIIKKNEQLLHGCIPAENSSTIRFSLIFLHVFSILLESEEDEDVAYDIVHSLEMIGLIAGPAFYLQGMEIINKLLHSIFAYNLPALEDYIDDTSYDILHDNCPLVIHGIRFFESIFLSFPEVAPAFTLNHIQNLWSQLKTHLIPKTDCALLAALFHLASTILEVLHEQASFMVNDLMPVLMASFQNPNENCRGEACRCVGWICQVFPSYVSSAIDTLIEHIMAAMQKQKGDCGEAVDLATSALNRILKNVMDSPKRTLFINVLNNLPPTQNFSEAESVYKTLFDMIENKGEMFNEFIYPLTNALVRSLMKQQNLSPKLRLQIYHCLLSMNQENAEAFSSIINSFSQEEINFVSSLFENQYNCFF